MIKLTRLSGEELVVNAELIETAEATPDTVLSLTTGRRLIVRESLDDLIELVVAYRRSLGAAAGIPGREVDGGGWPRRPGPAAAGEGGER